MDYPKISFDSVDYCRKVYERNPTETNRRILAISMNILSSKFFHWLEELEIEERIKDAKS